MRLCSGIFTVIVIIAAFFVFDNDEVSVLLTFFVFFVLLGLYIERKAKKKNGDSRLVPDE